MPQRSKLVEFFAPHPDVPGDAGRALRVSRYFESDERPPQFRFSIWSGDSADAAVSLTEDEAARLADRGDFSAAVKCCHAQLRQSGPAAPAFLLLGLICDTTGDCAGAAKWYRKALYLDPHRHDIQIHLALLLEKQGATAEALVLRHRAHRLKTRRTP